MPQKCQTPPFEGGAGRDLLGGWSRSFITQTDWQTQWLASRYSLPLARARQISLLAFGEGSHD
jgi:hypothetical protein